MVVPGGRGRLGGIPELGGIQVLGGSPELGGIQALPHLGAGRCSQPRGCSGVPAGSGGATFIPAGLSRLTLCRGVRAGAPCLAAFAVLFVPCRCLASLSTLVSLSQTYRFSSRRRSRGWLF